MKMFIFSLWLLYPGGEMDMSSSIVLECPTQEEVKTTFQKMRDDGAILNAMAVCQPIDMREAKK